MRIFMDPIVAQPRAKHSPHGDATTRRCQPCALPFTDTAVGDREGAASPVGTTRSLAT